jgi:dihydroorotate dehydrogenase (NAD+) catalytic subunit
MNTEINLGGIVMKNPVMVASGTFGYGREYGEFYDLNRLGALVPKTVTPLLRNGNPQPRTAEVYGGMLNSIGLQNPGIDGYEQEVLPFLEQLRVPIIANISGFSTEDFVKIARRLSISQIAGLELNISCPNVEKRPFGKDPTLTYEIVHAVRQETDKPLIVKLTPDVTNIIGIAEAAQEAGADALAMVNTVTGMAIDIETRKPRIHGGGRYMGGLSGPGIKPIGIAKVYQVYHSGNPLPIVGIGGISNADDAIEYMLAGATAVSVGTANFTNPMAPIETIEGIEDYMRRHNVEDVNELIGAMEELE